MGIWLNMQTADGHERPFPVNVARMVIGRDSRCDVHIALPTVAPRHCEIAVEGARATLTDLGSASGTLYNGSRLTERAVLETGDRITIGLVTFIVRVEPTLAPDAALRSPGLHALSGEAAKEDAEESEMAS